MIKFHYHVALKDVPRLGIVRGNPLCHVYSDVSRRELIEWGRQHDLKARWIHERTIPHFDAFGERLAGCGDGVRFSELKADIRAWRDREGQ